MSFQTKILFRCKKMKFRGPQCEMKTQIVIKRDGNFMVQHNGLEHTCENASHGFKSKPQVSLEVINRIQNLFRSEVRCRNKFRRFWDLIEQETIYSLKSNRKLAKSNIKFKSTRNNWRWRNFTRRIETISAGKFENSHRVRWAFCSGIWCENAEKENSRHLWKREYWLRRWWRWGWKWRRRLVSIHDSSIAEIAIADRDSRSWFYF